MDTLKEHYRRDRRYAKRFNIKTALRVRVWKADVPEKRAESLNLSQRGIFFATDSLVAKGEVLEILLKMPEEITGEPTTEWRCTGHVVRIEPMDSPRGRFGVGVHFYCYDVSRPRELPRPAAHTLTARVPMHFEP